MSKRLVKIGASISVAALMLMSLSSAVYAQAPSAAQMAAFQALSPAEQQRLAKQFGVDVPSVTGASTAQPLPQTLVKESALAPVADVSSEVAEGEDVIAQKNIDAEEAQKKAQAKPPLRYFGYDVFSGTPTSFTPIADLPVPLDYIVGPGDELSIQLFGKENEHYLLTVGRDGAIDMPKLGPIPVAGSSFKQVKEDLALRIKKQIIGAEVSIGMGQLRLMQIYVLGDAAHPGAYNLSSLATVSQALIIAGGIAETGSLRKIEVRRGKRSVAIIDLYDLLVSGDLSNDIRLQSGDAVFVHPVGSRVAIDGEVLRPAVYEIQQATILKDLIGIAGGLLPEAYDKAIQIKRQSDTGVKLVTQDLSEVVGQIYRLKSGDSIYVQKRNRGFREQIVLSGAVVQPGRRGYTEGLRVSDVLGDIDANLRDDADLSLAMLVRERSRNVQILYLSLQEILNNPRSPENLKLRPGDELVVMPTYLSYQGNNKESDITALAKKRAELIGPALRKLRQQTKAGRVEQSVEISGPVKFPGIYPYAESLNLADALMLAGGLGEKADRTHAEISRLNFEGDSPELTHIIVNLFDAVSVENFKLQPRDHVNIFEGKEWANTSLRMTLTGEVKYPGTYVVQRGTSIKQLIDRAGGLTEYAFPEGAVLSRASLKVREQEHLQRLNDRLKEEVATLSLRKSSPLSGLSVSPKEAIDVVDALGGKEALGRLVIDLPAILASADSGLVAIKDGDFMHIPAHFDTVTVVGEVQYASSHLYEKGLSYKDYIARAGGVRQRADKDRIYIIRASGEVVLPKNSWFGVSVNEGDTVVVPIDAEYTDKLSTFSTLTQILYQMGVAYDVIAR